MERGRVVVGGQGTAIAVTKTRRGKRVMPLTDDVTAALKRMRREQPEERMALGRRVGDDSLIAVDEIGMPVRPEAYSAAWRRLCKKAGVRDVTLHVARHSSVTAMCDKGVPDHVVAKWHGHDEAVMRRTYSHAHDDMLRDAADVLGQVMDG